MQANNPHPLVIHSLGSKARSNCRTIPITPPTRLEKKGQTRITATHSLVHQGLP